MLFNSYEFILIFMPITLIVYYTLARFMSHTVAKYFLILASVCFYSYWDIGNLPILLGSIMVNYVFGYILTRKRTKIILLSGIAFNLLFLGYFKYTGFIIDNLNSLLSLRVTIQNIVLPLGISFFTFTQTAYLVDIYRGETKEYSCSDYLLFVTIFPHLIAGPILYHKDMIPQFSESDRYKLNYRNMVYGIAWFVIGLFKKVIIADRLAVYANKVFDYNGHLTMLDAWGGSLAYTLQLYFDFSGYSEMAIGLGLMLNYNLPLNFNYPYRACSIIEFWRRWHMTLSSFLRDYLYIPLGGNRNGHHMRNILITMFLGGLWHGAGWTYIFWGGIHGCFICINHLWRKTSISLPKCANWLLTFNAVNVAWIFFRADSFERAIGICNSMIDVSNFYLPYSGTLEKYVSAFGYEDISIIPLRHFIEMFLCLYLSTRIIKIISLENINYLVVSLVMVLVFVYCLLSFSSITEFLYFQF